MSKTKVKEFRLQAISDLDYNTRLKIAIAMFVFCTIIILILFIISIKSNFIRFNQSINDVKESSLLKEIPSNINNINQEVEQFELEMSNIENNINLSEEDKNDKTEEKKINIKK